MLRHDAGRTPSAPLDVLELLDAFQAAERVGVAAVGRWLATCEEPRLRGGLRVIRARGIRHAALAEQRLRALGGAPSARVSRGLVALCEVVGDPGVSDRSKLVMLTARAPAKGRSPLAAAVDRLAGDPETRALLATIDEDGQASLEWLGNMRTVLEREGR
jgi:hypothetical protein